jgi:hypothetical protein
MRTTLNLAQVLLCAFSLVFAPTITQSAQPTTLAAQDALEALVRAADEKAKKAAEDLEAAAQAAASAQEQKERLRSAMDKLEAAKELTESAIADTLGTTSQQVAEILGNTSESAEISDASPQLTASLYRTPPTIVPKPLPSRAAILAQMCRSNQVRIMGSIVDDLVVGLAGSVVESLIDSLAMKFEPDSSTLESTIPVDGLYKGTEFSYNGGCLVFHNGDDTAYDKAAPLEAVFMLGTSPDSTAINFTVVHWAFKNFTKNKVESWGQQKGVRDIAVKLEFLSPSSEGIGQRKIFVEHTFTSVSKEQLGTLFRKNQTSPWLALPTNAASGNMDIHQPVNLKVTLVETTRQGRFAKWIQKAAAGVKDDVSTAVKVELKKALDSGYAATEAAKAAEAAGKAYDEYAKAQTDLAKIVGEEPATEGTPEHNSWKVRVAVATQLVETKKVLAKQAFSAADLQWPEVS